MNRVCAALLDLRKRLFLDGGHHHFVAARAGRIQHQERKFSVAGDQSETSFHSFHRPAGEPVINSTGREKFCNSICSITGKTRAVLTLEAPASRLLINCFGRQVRISPATTTCRGCSQHRDWWDELGGRLISVTRPFATKSFSALAPGLGAIPELVYPDVSESVIPTEAPSARGRSSHAAYPHHT